MTTRTIVVKFDPRNTFSIQRLASFCHYFTADTLYRRRRSGARERLRMPRRNRIDFRGNDKTTLTAICLIRLFLKRREPRVGLVVG